MQDEISQPRRGESTSYILGLFTDVVDMRCGYTRR